MIKGFRKLFSGARWTFKGKVGGAVSQGVFIILLARTLEVQEFGLFTGIIAFIHFFTPFLGFGSDSLLIRNISREKKSYAVSVAISLKFYLLSAFVLSGFLYLLNSYILSTPFPYYLFWYLVAAEFLFQIAHLPGRIFQSFEHMKGASIMWFLVVLTKLLTVFFFVLFEGGSIELWSVWYFSGALIISFLLFGGTLLTFGRISFRGPYHGVSMSLRKGLAFSFSNSLEKTYSDVDKFMLLKLASQQAVGLYGAAYQFLKFADLPVRSLLAVTYPVFFQKGDRGVESVFQYAKKLLPYTFFIGLAVSGSLFVAAPLAPLLLGNDYQATVHIIRWLALVPFLQSIYRIPADALSGSGKQNLRVKIQLIAVILNVALNFVMIPMYSWNGAIAATLISEMFLVGAFGIMMFYYLR